MLDKLLRVSHWRLHDAHKFDAIVQVCDEVRVAAPDDIRLWKASRSNELYGEIDIFYSHLLACCRLGFVPRVGASLA
jgi:hypothetical protein